MQGCTVFLLLSCVWLFATPWIGSCQTPLSSTISLSLLKLSPLSWWCYLNISSSAAHFSFCLQSFPATKEDGGVEGRALIFSCKNSKLQLADEQPLTGKCWIPPEKDTSHPKAKEKPQQDSRKGKIVFRIRLHTHQRHLEGSNKTLCASGPRDPTRDRARPAFECLSVSCRGMGQQWPATETEALAAADLGGVVCGIKSSWRRSTLATP